jgi:adenylate cyclase
MTLSALRDVRMLERQRAGLSQFFSPVVLEALQGVDPEVVLSPRETEVSVLFCDLRGFSRHSERSAEDLLGLLNRVSQALGVTTHQIREQGGVLGDFHGDAAMGFWGWPLAQPDAAVRACSAALAIRAQFAETALRVDDPLADFRVGIGIATGRAVAGKIGTIDQVKVTVFGPVVNLASRLEGMTRILHAPILVDERTAIVVRNQLSPKIARLRRVAVVKPYGLDRKVEVTELLPSESEYPQLSDENIADYERALDELIAGRWSQAFDRLHRVPADDRVKDFLTVLIAQHNRTPPDNWNGVIPLSTK